MIFLTILFPPLHMFSVLAIPPWYNISWTFWHYKPFVTLEPHKLGVWIMIPTIHEGIAMAYDWSPMWKWIITGTPWTLLAYWIIRKKAGQKFHFYSLWMAKKNIFQIIGLISPTCFLIFPSILVKSLVLHDCSIFLSSFNNFPI